VSQLETGLLLDLPHHDGSDLHVLERPAEMGDTAVVRLRMPKAQSADRAKGRFLATMSHELRTPLNAIIGFSDLMDPDDADPGEEQRLVPAEWVRHIRTSGRHLLNLINDILDLAKVEAGRIDLKPEPLPLPAIIAEVVTTLRPVADRKGLRVGTDPGPEVPGPGQDR